jgi:putative ATPase
VPLHLKDSHTVLAKRLGQGKSYLYSHNYPQGISGQDYLSKPLELYHPLPHGAEAALAERLAQLRQLKANLREQAKE